MDFDWLDKPEPAALRLLKIYCARSAPGQPLGQRQRRADRDRPGDAPPADAPALCPNDDRRGRRGCVNEAALCAAFLSGRDILVRSARDDKKVQAAQEPFRDGAGSDFEVLIRAWQFARASRYNIDDCRAHGIHAGACREAEATFSQLLHLAKRHGMTTDENAEPDRSKATALRFCILSAFADQISVRRDTGTLHCTLPHGRSGTLVRESVVQQSPLLVVAEIRQVSARGNRATLLSLASAIEMDWVRELFNELTTQPECNLLPKRVEA